MFQVPGGRFAPETIRRSETILCHVHEVEAKYTKGRVNLSAS